MWYVKINGNPTVSLRDEPSAQQSFYSLRHWRGQGHTVQLFQGTRDVTPDMPHESR